MSDTDHAMPRYMALARHVRRCRRQLDRTVASFERVRAAEREMGFEYGEVPAAIQTLRDDFDDDCYFLLLTANHVQKARYLASQAGLSDLPEMLTAADARDLRDLSEHWDAVAEGKARASRRWSDRRTGRPLGHFTRGSEGLLDVGGLSIPALRRDLDRLADACDTWLTQWRARTSCGPSAD